MEQLTFDGWDMGQSAHNNQKDLLSIITSPLGVKVKKLSSDSKLPVKNHKGDACFDLYANEGGYISNGVVTVIGTGIAVEVPYGYVLEIYPRSGLASKGITTLTSPGIIDHGYVGEVKVILTSLADDYKVNRHERIAQCALKKLEDYEFLEAETLSVSKRGEKGLGSSGKY